MLQVLFVLQSSARKSAEASCLRACRELAAFDIKAQVLSPEEEAPFFLSQKQMPNNEEVLYVTDSAKLLQQLKTKEEAVIALSHEGNAEEDFTGAAYIFSEPDEIDADSYIKAYERQKNIPWKILGTKRLLVRETTVTDVDRFYEIYADPSMTRYMEGLFDNPEDEKHYMRDYIKNVYGLMGFGVWSVLLRETGEVIGRAGYSIRKGFDKPELGFLIGTKWQKRGYATEVLQGVLAYGKDVLGFETVQALVKEGNDVSVHLLKKLGFQIAGKAQAEENIYGNTYEGIGVAGTSTAGRGTYIEMVLQTGTDDTCRREIKSLT